MITESFSIKGHSRMAEIYSFIRINMPTCRFINNPLNTSDDNWKINISYEIEDINKLNTLMNKYNLEDEKIEKREKYEKTFRFKIINFFKNIYYIIFAV
jgi:hypothetical protein